MGSGRDVSAGDSSWSPRVSGKTGATGAAGALVVVLVWVLPRAGIDMPGDVAAALAVLVTVVMQYALPVRTKGKYEA